MINKIKKIIKKWLGVPEDLIYRIQTLNTWSMENERRRHLLHDQVDGHQKGLIREKARILALENKISQLEKKEHALRRYFGVKYREYFTYDLSKAPKIPHYEIVLESEPEIPSTPTNSYADEKYKASISEKTEEISELEKRIDKEVDDIILSE